MLRWKANKIWWSFLINWIIGYLYPSHRVFIMITRSGPAHHPVYNSGSQTRCQNCFQHVPLGQLPSSYLFTIHSVDQFQPSKFPSKLPESLWNLYDVVPHGFSPTSQSESSEHENSTRHPALPLGLSLPTALQQLSGQIFGQIMELNTAIRELWRTTSSKTMVT